MTTDLAKRVHYIRSHLLADSSVFSHTLAAQQSLVIIETALRELLAREVDKLLDADRNKVQQEIARLAKGGRGKTVRDFTLGQLVGVLRDGDFFNAYNRATGKSVKDLQMVNLEVLNSVRNEKLIHLANFDALSDPAYQVSHDFASTVFHYTCLLLEHFGIQSLEHPPASLTQPLPAAPPTSAVEVKTYLNKLPESDAPFLGRSRELALLDQAWQDKGLLVLVAWGGVGKTRLVARWLDGLREQGWAGAARVYAWSFYSQGAAEDRQVSADSFVEHALRWFGNRDELTDPFAKTERLAELLQAQPSLLILDGLEPLQHPLGTHDGEVKDKAQVFLQPRSVGTRKEKYPFLG